jgi:hypothetical protein
MQNIVRHSRRAQSANCQPDSPAILKGETPMKNIRILITTLLVAAASISVHA